MRRIQCQTEDKLDHDVDEEAEQGDQDSKERVHEETAITPGDAHLLVHSRSGPRLAVVVLLVVILCQGVGLPVVAGMSVMPLKADEKT